MINIDILINGKITGVCVVIDSISDFNTKDIKNKIIVIKKITLDILPNFYDVKGIIVEEGTLLSHVSIFIREIGVPMVKIEDALKKYKDNDIVSL